MVANLPPQYWEEEKKLKFAETIEEKIKILRNMLSIVPKHKGTEKLQADIKTKIARLEKESKRQKGARVYSYSIKKEGIGQVLLVGFTNSGKSSLLTLLTNATPDIKEYPFTTTEPAVGMLSYSDVKIQLIELPAIGHQFTNRWLNSLLPTCDLVLFLVDLSNINDEVIEKIKEIKKRKETLIIGNKIDLPGAKDNAKLLPFDFIPISCNTLEGIEDLPQKIFSALKVIRVYTKEPGKETDFTEPLILKEGATVIDAVGEIHKDFVSKLKYVRIWREGKYQGQRIERTALLCDKDIIEVHI